MADSKIYVVIPNWNGKDLLDACLSSLQTQTHKHTVVIVDNGSTDGSASYIKKNYPEIQLIVRDKNYGFTGGVNPGIEAAIEKGAEFVALLNNDAVVEKDWLEKLAKTMSENPKAGIVTSKILRMDKKHLDSTGDFYSIWGLPFPRGRNEVDSGKYDDQLEVFGASGGASLYRTALFDEIGLFDQDFFAYFEDVDLSFRAQLAGWKVRYQPQAIAYHHLNATASKLGNFARYHSAKNFLLVYAKNMPLKLYLKYLPLYCLQFLRMLITSMLRGHLWTFLRGSSAAIKLHPKTLKKRRQIQGSRKVSISYTDGILYHHRPPRPPKLEKA